MKKNIFYSILFLFFLFIFSIFYKGLDNSNIYTTEKIKNENLSAFISKELFSNEQFDSNDIIKVNKFTIINIWSSWCIPCKQEHSVLMDLKEKTNINIIGLNYKDKKNNAINFINKLGNPFSKILIDPDGVISISLGAYGVPETFLLNSESKVIRKYIGPLTYDNILEIINLIKS
tara:strand:- start:131 stop:655 length:525 start_codon:yes stop_codon:yes gene_type:complete